MSKDNNPPPVQHVLPIGDNHPDALAVDRFAAAMKAKLAKKRADGRGGWENPAECSIAFLSELLREHVNKGDPVDVGNLAMMEPALQSQPVLWRCPMQWHPTSAAPFWTSFAQHGLQ